MEQVFKKIDIEKSRIKQAYGELGELEDIKEEGKYVVLSLEIPVKQI